MWKFFIIKKSLAFLVIVFILYNSKSYFESILPSDVLTISSVQHGTDQQAIKIPIIKIISSKSNIEGYIVTDTGDDINKLNVDKSDYLEDEDSPAILLVPIHPYITIKDTIQLASHAGFEAILLYSESDYWILNNPLFVWFMTYNLELPRYSIVTSVGFVDSRFAQTIKNNYVYPNTKRFVGVINGTKSSGKQHQPTMDFTPMSLTSIFLAIAGVVMFCFSSVLICFLFSKLIPKGSYGSPYYRNPPRVELSPADIEEFLRGSLQRQPFTQQPHAPQPSARIVTQSDSATRSGSTAGFIGNLTTEGQNCPICLDDMQGTDVLRLQCNHDFHSNCIHAWVNQNLLNRACPICRCGIRTDPELAFNPTVTDDIRDILRAFAVRDRELFFN